MTNPNQPTTYPTQVSKKDILIDGNLIATLSFGLYTKPLEIYRELVQNSADAYQESNTPRHQRRIDIKLNRFERSATVRDYASGISNEQFTLKLVSIGYSHKIGQNLRGFRGIGRLAALGYCKTLIFRSRQSEDEPILELRLEAENLKSYAKNQNIIDTLMQSTKISKLDPSPEWPDRFFETELRNLVFCKNDALLNPTQVGRFLSEIGPVPFHRNFYFRNEIHNLLGDSLLFDVQVYINESDKPLYRPHRNEIRHPVSKKVISEFRHVEQISEFEDLLSINNILIARGWVLHHNYPGALPRSSLVSGIRVRIGNIQIGSGRIFEHLFKETRFNSWCVGEIHICNPHINPNTRRDNLEESYHLDILTNGVGVLAHKLSAICRKHSLNRHNRKKQRNHELKLEPKVYKELVSKFKIPEPFPEKITFTMKR